MYEVPKSPENHQSCQEVNSRNLDSQIESYQNITAIELGSSRSQKESFFYYRVIIKLQQKYIAALLGLFGYLLKICYLKRLSLSQTSRCSSFTACWTWNSKGQELKRQQPLQWRVAWGYLIILKKKPVSLVSCNDPTKNCELNQLKYY